MTKQVIVLLNLQAAQSCSSLGKTVLSPLSADLQCVLLKATECLPEALILSLWPPRGISISKKLFLKFVYSYRDRTGVTNSFVVRKTPLSIQWHKNLNKCKFCSLIKG